MKRLNTTSFLPCFALLTLLFLPACQGEPETQEKKKPVAQTVVQPAFDADSAYYYVAKQVEFGPRTPNSAAAKVCAEWMTAQLSRWCDTTMTQSFTVTAHDGVDLHATNVIGVFKPEAKKRVLLCAHWDTRPIADQDTERKDEAIDGANDGASGVGVLLEMARQMHAKAPEIGVDIVLFDVEDYGVSRAEDSYCLGSQYWSKKPHIPGYRANYGILLDMVGAKNSSFYKEGHSVFFASSIVDKVWRNGHALGHSHLFRGAIGPKIIDDHYYINTIAGIPTIDIIHRSFNTRTGFGEYWHTHDDNMQVIDKATLKAVGETVLSTIYLEKAN